MSSGTCYLPTYQPVTVPVRLEDVGWSRQVGSNKYKVESILFISWDFIIRRFRRKKNRSSWRRVVATGWWNDWRCPSYIML